MIPAIKPFTCRKLALPILEDPSTRKTMSAACTLSHLPVKWTMHKVDTGMKTFRCPIWDVEAFIVHSNSKLSPWASACVMNDSSSSSVTVKIQQLIFTTWGDTEEALCYKLCVEMLITWYRHSSNSSLLKYSHTQIRQWIDFNHILSYNICTRSKKLPQNSFPDSRWNVFYWFIF